MKFHNTLFPQRFLLAPVFRTVRLCVPCCGTAARIILMTSTKKLTPIAAAELRHHVLKCSVPEPVRVALFEAIARQIEPVGDWAFVMISPERNDEVVAFCLSTERPKQTVRIWSYLLRHLRFDTGECDVTRSEIAEALGVAPRHVSASLMELARFGAIRKQRGPLVCES